MGLDVCCFGEADFVGIEHAVKAVSSAVSSHCGCSRWLSLCSEGVGLVRGTAWSAHCPKWKMMSEHHLTFLESTAKYRDNLYPVLLSACRTSRILGLRFTGFGGESAVCVASCTPKLCIRGDGDDRYQHRRAASV